jgi:hypothetical protein
MSELDKPVFYMKVRVAGKQAPSISSSTGILMLHSELEAQLLNGLNIMLAGKLIWRW